VAALKGVGHGAVAFSGGVDSTLLLKAAVDAYDGKASAFFVRSVLQKQGVQERVKQTCTELGCTVRIIDLNPMDWPEFVENNEFRCYYCKKNIYTHLLSLLPAEHFLLDGTNKDDLKHHRPGLRAISELGVKMPLVEAGLTKKDVRTLCRYFNLDVWDLPSESCLATRITPGVPVSTRLLQDVEQSERFLEKKGFIGCRARLDGRSVFIELSQGAGWSLWNDIMRSEVIKFFAKLNYPKVFLELSERPSILNGYS